MIEVGSRVLWGAQLGTVLRIKTDEDGIYVEAETDTITWTTDLGTFTAGPGYVYAPIDDFELAEIPEGDWAKEGF